MDTSQTAVAILAFCKAKLTGYTGPQTVEFRS
jgi:hypothetical protein